MNPFTYGRVVSTSSYCPRQRLEAALKSHLLSGQNNYIEGERRTGKTSLIFETIRTIKSRRIVYIDLLEVRSTEDVHKRVLSGIVKAEARASVLQSFLKKISALRPTMTFDPVSGLPSLSLDAAVGLKPESIDGLFGLFSEREFRNSVVVIDEFQDLLNLPDARQVLAVMRSKIQFLKSVPFVFCGSIRGKIHTIFNDADSPFFKSALPLEVGTIDRAAFKAFIASKFAGAKISVSPSMVDRLLGLTHENPGDTQQLCSAIYNVTSPRDTVGEETVQQALRHIFAEECKGYESHLARITGMQLRAIRTVARIGGARILSADFMTMSGIRHPSTIKKALSRLEELKILFTAAGEYKFVNPFFAQWLVWKDY
jgi:hypothetical protein